MMQRHLQALGRLAAGTLNRTEREYRDMLELRQKAGEVAWYKFEGLKLRLADATFYSPDFVVMLADGRLECHEVKGHWQDDARVKIKVAASLYPFQFYGVKKIKGGAWEVEAF
jgi:hypothetical protein